MHSLDEQLPDVISDETALEADILHASEIEEEIQEKLLAFTAFIDAVCAAHRAQQTPPSSQPPADNPPQHHQPNDASNTQASPGEPQPNEPNSNPLPGVATAAGFRSPSL